MMQLFILVLYVLSIIVLYLPSGFFPFLLFQSKTYLTTFSTLAKLKNICKNKMFNFISDVHKKITINIRPLLTPT